MADKSGRMVFRYEDGVETALRNRGVDEGHIESMIRLAKRFGNVAIAHFDALDDTSGRHYSVSLTYRNNVWTLVITLMPDY